MLPAFQNPVQKRPVKRAEESRQTVLPQGAAVSFTTERKQFVVRNLPALQQNCTKMPKWLTAPVRQAGECFHAYFFLEVLPLALPEFFLPPQTFGKLFARGRRIGTEKRRITGSWKKDGVGTELLSQTLREKPYLVIGAMWKELIGLWNLLSSEERENGASGARRCGL